MRKFKIGKISLLAFVLVALVAGCGREQAPSPALPTVIITSPANGATGVVLNTTVSAGFSSVMNPATINTTTLTVTGPGAAAVSGAVSYSGTTATFTPAVSLAANTVYIATITTGATDPGGNALAANFVWSFTTGAPTVISTVPANLATAVPVNTLVSATFSEPMNGATISCGSGHLCRLDRHVHANSGSCHQHFVYGHDYHRREGSGRCGAGSQFCVDLYNRSATDGRFHSSRRYSHGGSRQYSDFRYVQ
jgi:hypothetical protein